MSVPRDVIKDFKKPVRSERLYAFGQYAIVKAGQSSELMDELEECALRSRRLFSKCGEVSTPPPETVNTGTGLPFFYIYLGRI
jgi:hypothetical protein